MLAEALRLTELPLVFAEATGPVLNIPASLRWLLAMVLGGYMLLMLGISIYAKGKVETEEDFLVAGRRLGLFLAWGSLIATWFGAAAMSGAAGAAREEGFRGVILDPIACSATLVLAGLCFAAPLWRMKLLTVGDFFRETYGQGAEVICSILIIPAYFGWVAAQFKALGIVQEVYFGIPLEWGIVIGFLITLVYTSVGGMWSVTLTDTLQIVIAFAGLLCLGHVTFSTFGEGSAVGGVNRMVNELPPDFLTLLPIMTTAGVLGWTGTFCSGFFGCIPGQDLLQRVFSANSARTASLALAHSVASSVG
jgi:Na+/proline symporter